VIAQLVAKQVVEELQPWIQRAKEEHIRRAGTMGKRGFERIEKLWVAKINAALVLARSYFVKTLCACHYFAAGNSIHTIPETSSEITEFRRICSD